MSDMASGWRRLVERHLLQQYIGMEAGAEIIEADMIGTDAYSGQSGATRASSIAYVAMADDPNSAEPESAESVAAALLQGFEGHTGHALLVDAPGPGPNEIAIVATVPTDYIYDLEFDNAGEKAFLADTVRQDAPAAFDAAVRAMREAWR